MRFSFFSRPTSTGCLCTRELFFNTVDADSQYALIRQIREKYGTVPKAVIQDLKRKLPCVTWQGYATDGIRNEQHMEPNGLYMLDIDGVDDVQQLVAQLREAVLDCAYDEHTDKVTANYGVVLMHITPSGHGVRIVARKTQPDIATIADHQKWLADKLGIFHYDECCKDFARLSYLPTLQDILYIDDDLWETECPLKFENTAAAAASGASAQGAAATAAACPAPAAPATAAAPSAAAPSAPTAAAAPSATPAPKSRTFGEAERSFAYHGHLISDIAARYLAKVGTPEVGDRHNFYIRLVRNFRHITDNNMGVLLAQLPDLGKDIDEREKICTYILSRGTNGEMPYTFYRFLCEEGILPLSVPAAEESPEPPAEVEEPAETAVKRKERFPQMPPVFKEFTSLYPDEFVYPTVVALLPVLGTLTTRYRATYLDGREQTTSFISCIFAPQASGKSFARDIVRICTKDLREHDKISLQKERLWRREMKMKRNADEQPEEPHAPYRLVQAVISVPKLLERQEDAAGLHQFSFTEEIDTLIKSNQGGSYAQKSDLYRQAFDNAEYGQDYMKLDTFTGSVRLYYNILMLGTPNQLYKFFDDAENGLVSRCCFAEILGQEFAKIPFFRQLTERQMGTITQVLNRWESVTYTRKNALSDEYTVNDTVSLDAKMDFVRKALTQWLEEQRIVAMQEGNVSKDIFRRRSAVKAFRAAMIAVAMWDNITPNRERLITRWMLWLADEDLRCIEKAFGAMLSEKQKKDAPTPSVNIYESLADVFSAADVYAALRKAGLRSEPRAFVHIWKKNGLITKNEEGKYVKSKPIKKTSRR